MENERDHPSGHSGSLETELVPVGDQWCRRKRTCPVRLGISHKRAKTGAQPDAVVVQELQDSLLTDNVSKPPAAAVVPVSNAAAPSLSLRSRKETKALSSKDTVQASPRRTGKWQEMIPLPAAGTSEAVHDCK